MNLDDTLVRFYSFLKVVIFCGGDDVEMGS